MTPGAPQRLSYLLAIVWVGLTVSLASWWLVVGLNLTRQLRDGTSDGEAGANFHRMFIWEGAVFIALLLAGGIALVLAIRREYQRRHALETFFMAFTHDLKTAIARVQLQAENLLEDWPAPAPRAPLERLAGDTVRLQIQLENSLFVAQPDGRLLEERIDVAESIARLARDWPDVEVRVTGSAAVTADARAFDTIFRNLLQNADGKRITGLLAGTGRKIENNVPAYKSNITPEEVSLYSSGKYVEWLPTRRIDQLLERPQQYGALALQRVKHTRFTQPLVNVILLLLAIPCVMTREPTRLKAAATQCLLLTGACLAVSFLAQQMSGQPPYQEWAGMWPAVMAWLPILIFGPVAVFLLDRVET